MPEAETETGRGDVMGKVMDAAGIIAGILAIVIIADALSGGKVTRAVFPAAPKPRPCGCRDKVKAAEGGTASDG